MPDAGPFKASKSARKRAHKRRQQDVDQLCRLSPDKLASLPLPALLIEQLEVARQMKPSSARNRQLRYLAGLIDKLDADSQAQIDKALGN